MASAELIRSFVKHDAEFIIAGGVAALLQGAPIHTLDLGLHEWSLANRDGFIAPITVS